jgi:hypothetical protein
MPALLLEIKSNASGPMHETDSESSVTGNLSQPQLGKIGQRLDFQTDSCEDWQAGTVTVMYTDGRIALV